jgi:hypothetical protein
MCWHVRLRMYVERGYGGGAVLAIVMEQCIGVFAKMTRSDACFTTVQMPPRKSPILTYFSCGAFARSSTRLRPRIDYHSIFRESLAAS